MAIISCSAHLFQPIKYSVAFIYLHNACICSSDEKVKIINKLSSNRNKPFSTADVCSSKMDFIKHMQYA